MEKHIRLWRTIEGWTATLYTPLQGTYHATTLFECRKTKPSIPNLMRKYGCMIYIEE